MLKVEEKPLILLIEDDLETMMHAHWQECSIDKEQVPFNPDWDTALLSERSGVLHAFALFQDGELAGYAVFEVCPHLHFKTTTHAYNMGFYVKPEHRKGAAAIKLFVDSEEKLKALGVQKISYSTPFASNLNKLLEKDGFVPSETLWTKLVA